MAVQKTSIIDGLKNLGTQAAAPTNSAEERKVSEFWANIGYTTTSPDTGDDLFIGLPYGIALDTMKPRDLPKTNVKMRQLRVAQNALLEKLQAAAAQLEPGESIIVPLQIELRRNPGEEGITDADTALVKDFDLFPVK